jgi:hypothetical protein
MSHPPPTDVRVKFVRPYGGTMPDLYQAWLEPEHRYLGIVQKVSSDEWSAYLPDKGRPVATGCPSRANAGAILRSRSGESVSAS